MLMIIILSLLSHIKSLYHHDNHVVHHVHDINAVLLCVHLLPRSSSDSITVLLKQLHWLPVAYRIKYKRKSTKSYNV